MSILVMNSFRGKNIPYNDWLGESHQDILMLCSEEQDTSIANYRFSQTFKAYEDNPEVVAVAADIIETHKATVIIAKSECDLLRAGKLRDQFGIEGQTYDQALAFRDKIVMKSILHAGGVRVPKNAAISEKEEAIAFGKTNGFPLVLKPVDGAGSINTVIFKSLDDLLNTPASQFKAGMEVEEFIAGDMYHIDGIIIGGKVRFIYPSKYLTGCLGYQENQCTSSYVLDYSHPLRERLIEFTKTVLDVLPSPLLTTFHAEVFHTPDDQLVFCEIASRTGGARVSETIQASFGINLDKLWIQAQAGLSIDEADVSRLQPLRSAGWILIPPRKATLIQFADVPPPAYVIEYQRNGQLGKNYSNPEKSSDCVASFVLGGDDQNEVIKNIYDIEEWFKTNSIWSDAVSN